MSVIQLWPVSGAEHVPSTGMPDAGQSKLESLSGTFSNYMQQTTANSAQAAVQQNTVQQQKNTEPGSGVQTDYAQYQAKSAAQAERLADKTADSSGTAVDSTAVDEAVQNAAEEIKDLLKEELGVDEQQIEEAMQLLGLAQADLLNPQQLTMLSMELTGSQDVGMMLFRADFQNVMQGAAAITQDLLQELGMTMEQLISQIDQISQDQISQDQISQDQISQNQISQDQISQDQPSQANQDQMLQTAPDQVPQTAPDQIQPEQTQNVEASAIEVPDETQAGMPQGSVQQEASAADSSVSLSGTNAQNELQALEQNMQNPQLAADQAASRQAQTAQNDSVQGAQNTEQQAGQVPQLQQEQPQQTASQQAQTDQQPEPASQAGQGSQLQQESQASQEQAGQESQLQQEQTAWYSGADMGSRGRSTQQEQARTDFGVNMPQHIDHTPPVQNTVSQAPMPQVNVQDVIRQIVEYTRMNLTEHSRTIEMQLNPENLGRVYIHISEKEGAVTAQITAQNENLKDALMQQAVILKDNLNQQGIKVDAVEVSAGAHEFESNLEKDARQQEEQARQQEEQTSRRSRRSINLNAMEDLDGMSGLMSEEEMLAARIMRDNGNNVDFKA